MEPSAVHEERVTFAVDSIEVVGIVRVPVGAHASAALVFAGPLTSVKEQVTGNYAVAMAARGFVTLTFDHRHFGESAGFPRQYAHPARKVEDFRAAFGFLRGPSRSSIRGASALLESAPGLAISHQRSLGTTACKAWAAVAGFFHDATAPAADAWASDYDPAIEESRPSARAV